MPIVNDNGTNREMTAKETTAYEAWAASYVEYVENLQIIENDRLAKRQAALTKLGLTANEIAILFG